MLRDPSRPFPQGPKLTSIAEQLWLATGLLENAARSLYQCPTRQARRCFVQFGHQTTDRRDISSRVGLDLGLGIHKAPT